MISQKQADSIARRFFPTKYSPKIKGSPIAGVAVISEEDLRRMLSGYMYLSESSWVGGAAVDWFKIKTDLGHPATEEDIDGANRFIIFINENINFLTELIFILLHELGHVNRKLCVDSKDFAGGNEELYADMYAFDLLKDKIGDDLALEMLLTFGSTEGYNKEKEDNNEDCSIILR